MMRKDVSGGQRSKFKKKQKKDEKRHFRRSKVKVLKIRKNDEKGLSGGGEVQNQKIRKNDEKRRFRSQFK
jgi:hypothetical protein